MKDDRKLLKEIWEVLYTVNDPEIPAVSVVDLGMIHEADCREGIANIKALPTFMGCPALDIIKENIESAILKIEGIRNAKVEFIYDPPWTSDRVSDKGRENLKKFGIAPPPKYIEEDGMWKVDCPYCNSPYTTFDNLFGPTACRSLLYCRSCKNPFEAMKPISTM